MLTFGLYLKNFCLARRSRVNVVMSVNVFTSLITLPLNRIVFVKIKLTLNGVLQKI
jgi:hypothetical protein